MTGVRGSLPVVMSAVRTPALSMALSCEVALSYDDAGELP
jgi:hypothetical protein